MDNTRTNGTKFFWGGIILTLLVACGYYFFMNKPSSYSPTSTETATSTEVTIYGTYECLPHKDTSGPTTLECAYGLKADADGAYYGLDLTDISSATRLLLSADTKITVEGMFTPIKPGSTQTYNIVGTIRVSNIIFGTFESKG